MIPFLTINLNICITQSRNQDGLSFEGVLNRQTLEDDVFVIYTQQHP